MKLNIILLACLLLLFTVCRAQTRPDAAADTAFSNASGINNINVDRQTVNNLALLGQVWGFVKYHLPSVAAGKVNMDAELFRVMPAVISAKNSEDACAVLEKWVDGLGKPKICKSCKPIDSKDAIETPDYGILFDTKKVTKTLANKLSYILNNRNTGDNYYIKMADGIGNPVFQHELPYSQIKYPDAGVRLLTLFRYWNMIQYFYPYKHLIGADWNAVLYEFIPQFIGDRNESEYAMTAMKLIASIHDTHANIWGPPLKGVTSYRGDFAPPFLAKFIENKLVVAAFYSDTSKIKTLLKRGDVITSINGISVDSLIKKYLPVTPASNYERQLRDMPGNYLLRSSDSVFRFDVMRDNEVIKIQQQAVKYFKLHYALFSLPKDPGYYVLDGNIGYLYPGKYHSKNLADIKNTLGGTKGIIIDMRCYPSEFMPFTLVPYVKSGKASFVKFGRGSVDNPGLFKTGEPTAVPEGGEYKGKVVVIVNSETLSQSEYTTMALQSSPNVTVIGSKTAGADGDVCPITLPGGINTLISGLEILYPDGTETQRRGIKIDEQVKPTIAGIKDGRDELLERAKAIIGGK